MAQIEHTVPQGGRAADAVRLPSRLANYLRLGLDASTNDQSATPRSAIWVEIDESHTRLHEPQDVPLTTPGAIDIVVTGYGGLDISFTLPNGPLAELRQMIDGEIRHRSPFADGAHAAFWTATEAEDGAWRIDATIVMRAVLDRATKLATDRGGRLGLLRRDGAETSYAALPTPDAAADSSALKTALHFMAQAPSGLRAAIAGTVILLASASALWVDAQLDNRQIVDAASAARSEIGARAAAAAERRALDTLRASSNSRLALVGIFAALLPDGVWLDQLTVEGDEIVLTGFGPSTTDVQRRLSALTFLTDVRLAAPVTRDNSQSIERFRIAATLSGPVLPPVGGAS